MKILHVAVFKSTSTNVWQADAFNVLGHAVIRYDYRRRAVELDGKLTNNNPKRDQELITLCKKELPDLILFSKCNQMNVKVIEECGKVGTTALWYMDPKGNIDNELILKMGAVHYVFSARWDGYYESLKHNPNTFRICEGYDPKVHFPHNVPKKYNVSFIGQLRQNRQKFANHVDFDIITDAYNEKHAIVVSESKINLNFTEGDGTSDRTYKVLAAGGFLLTQPWHKMEEDFEVGKDFDIFTTVGELKHKINFYIRNEDKRNEIALHGMRTVEKYNNIEYARRIVEVTNG